MRKFDFLIKALLLSAAFGCSATEPIEGPPTFRGPVVGIEGNGDRFLIQAEPPGASSGRIWIRVGDAPIRLSGALLTSPSTIRTGDILNVWTSHAVLESEPRQTTADVITVERIAR